MQVNNIRDLLNTASVAALRDALKKHCGRIGFDPARDPRTATKSALIDYLVSRLEESEHDGGDTVTLEYVAELLKEPNIAKQPELVAPAPSKPAQPAPPVNTDPNTAALGAQLAAILSQLGAAKIDAEQVKQIATAAAGDAIKTALAGFVAPLQIEIKRPDAPASVKIDRAHVNFPRALRAAQARRNVWLYGPPGTGKTTAGQQIAEALGLKFYSSGAVDSAHALIGYQDAQGREVWTAFRHAFATGGVFLWDEMDVSHPAAVMAINAALANRMFTFPGNAEPTPMHADCVVIVGANTKGDGGVNGHSRLRLDESSRDRYVFIDWPLDEALEAAITPDSSWLARVVAARKWAAARGITGAVITPRASINGAAMLATGESVDVVDAATWGRALTAEQLRACQQSIPAYKKAA